MTGTNVVVAKRALFARLSEEAVLDGLLEGVVIGGVLQRIQVSYEWPGQNAEMLCVYGGYGRFTQANAVAEPHVYVNETAYVSVFIKAVQRPACSVEITDNIVSLIAGQVVKVLAKDPRLTPDLSWASIGEGALTYEQPEGSTISRLDLQVEIISAFGYQ